MRRRVKPPRRTPGPPGPSTPGPQDPQDPFKTFRQAFEGVLKEFAMQFEAHLLEIPYEMKKKAGETVLGSPRGVSHGFHMDFTWISHGFFPISHGIQMGSTLHGIVSSFKTPSNAWRNLGGI